MYSIMCVCRATYIYIKILYIHVQYNEIWIYCNKKTKQLHLPLLHIVNLMLVSHNFNNLRRDFGYTDWESCKEKNKKLVFLVHYSWRHTLWWFEWAGQRKGSLNEDGRSLVRGAPIPEHCPRSVGPAAFWPLEVPRIDDVWVSGPPVKRGKIFANLVPDHLPDVFTLWEAKMF